MFKVLNSKTSLSFRKKNTQVNRKKSHITNKYINTIFYGDLFFLYIYCNNNNHIKPSTFGRYNKTKPIYLTDDEYIYIFVHFWVSLFVCLIFFYFGCFSLFFGGGGFLFFLSFFGLISMLQNLRHSPGNERPILQSGYAHAQNPGFYCRS